MGEKIHVGSRDEFVKLVSEDNDNQFDEATAEELYNIWEFRCTNGSTNVIVTVPEWFSKNEFEARRPAFFATVEYDEPSKGAILFSDARLIDVSIIENQIWEQVNISETLELLDISDKNDYIDEPGKIWIPRSLANIYIWDQ